MSVMLLGLVMAPSLADGDARAATSRPPVSEQRDVQYGSADGVELLMDVYVPVAGPSPHPAIVVAHGGGFYTGDKSDPDVSRASRIFAALGYTVFNVNYRLAPEFPFPAANLDVQEAVRFIRDNAERFSIDPARIGIAGSSAGSTLAAWAGYVGKGPLDTGSRVSAVVTWSGAFDLPGVPSQVPAGDPRTDTASASHGYLVDGPDLLEQARAASPITYVDPTDPPILMTNGEHEHTPLQQPQAMLAELRNHGVPGRLVVHPGSAHALEGNVFSNLFGAAIFFDRELGNPVGMLASLERALSFSRGALAALVALLVGVVLVATGTFAPRRHRAHGASE